MTLNKSHETVYIFSKTKVSACAFVFVATLNFVKETFIDTSQILSFPTKTFLSSFMEIKIIAEEKKVPKFQHICQRAVRFE